MGTVCRQFITATATLILIVTAAQLPQVESSSIFELNLVSFDTRECWAGRQRSSNGLCQGSFYLRICIKHYQATVDPDSPCTFYEFLTPFLNYSADMGAFVLQDGHVMTNNLDFRWPGQFSFVIDAWHTSDETGSNKMLISRFKAQRSLEISANWTPDTLNANGSTVKIKYRVYCASHYFGPECETFCRTRDDTFGHYTCRDGGEKLCMPGWTGEYCQQAVCLEGCDATHGTCVKPHECKCRRGWEGQFCNTCSRYPGCQHGTCNQAYECNCDEGWGGLFCDQDLNYCTNHKPCWNGGTCTNTGQGSYTCSCSSEFMGKDCDKLQNPCQRNPCQNDGVCMNPSAGEYECQCAAGFFGPHCETSANICTNNPCENGGSCAHDPEGFVCICPRGFTGTLCENHEVVPCPTGYCLNGGTCVRVLNGSHCLCPHGHSGERCETAFSPCSYGGTCHNGGTCLELSTGASACTCAPGYTGAQCQHRLPCVPNPCANGGACHPLPHSGHRCDCPPGYRGPRCELRGDASDVSRRVSAADERPPPRPQVALVASLSTVLPVLALLLCCAVLCTIRRRRRRRRRDKKSPKECELDPEEELNNQPPPCNKIVNTLDRVMPPKVSNEGGPPKVLNIEVGGQKVVPEKGLVCAPRTLQKKDNMSGSTISCHLSQDHLPCIGGGIYVIEDHFRPRSETGSRFDIQDILATEV